MTYIEKQLQEARQNLLDLTMRNRLLNFRQTKIRTIKINDGNPANIYDIFVLNEKAMEFQSKPETSTANNTVKKEEHDLLEESEKDNPYFSEDDASLPKDDASKLWGLPPPESPVVDHNINRFLQTLLESESLQKRLFSINQQARSVFEEQGYTVLYLAVGFLEWTESTNPEQARLAPLILIPVELDRTRVGASFKLHWTGEDILTNISLQAKVAEQDILLPDFEMPEDKTGIDNYYRSVTKAISKIPKWKVRKDDIYLDFFSFAKFIMYKDLDPKAWPDGKSPIDHPLIKAILCPSSKPQGESGSSEDAGFSEDDVDTKLTMRDVYHVMDADPSQIAVIEDIKAGYNLVVEGPPGTGKSQTITNTIAELLAAGKNVLFVSEKMAALEVVKNRLDQVGLGDFCLELHSRKSNKKEVLKELKRSLSRSASQTDPTDEKFDRLEILKSGLNDYAKALREPFGGRKIILFDLFGIKEKALNHFAAVGKEMPRVSFSDSNKCDQKEWALAISKINDLSGALPLVNPLPNHPWRGCEPGTILPSDEEEIIRLIDDCIEAGGYLNKAINCLAEVSVIQPPTNLEELEHSINAAKIIAISKPIERHVLMNSAWKQPNELAEALIYKVEGLQTQLTSIRPRYKEEVMGQDIAPILEEYKLYSSRFFRIFDRKYRNIKDKIRSFYKKKIPIRAKIIISDLEQLIDCLKLRTDVREAEKTGIALFGSYWKGEESKPQILRELAEWIVEFRRLLLAKVFTELAIDVVSAGIVQKEVENASQNLYETKERFVSQFNHLLERVKGSYEGTFSKNAEKVPFQSFYSQLALWKAEIKRILPWAQFVIRRNACLKTIAGPLIDVLSSDILEAEDVSPCFEGNFADSLLRLAFEERPALADFHGTLHEDKIKRFMDLDRELIHLNRLRLAEKLYQNQPHMSGGASPGSEVGILLGEFSRKRGHMPIRKLMTLTGDLIQKIKPCFLMSPLSIAQFLDPKTVLFDVIIFDEASQVRPEDALGAILRGKQAAVIGDTRQLPPTSFFDHIVDSGESGEDNSQDVAASIADMESILHQCSRSFPSKILNWHYRSRHESLIAVSNQEFYDNKLRIYPSPIDQSKHLGLQFIHLRDATYDRGGSSVNRKEAKAVAKAVLEHYQMFPDKSLGVGTFNIPQQQAILEEIDLQLRLNPEMEVFFKSNQKEHFFVKNLETIQGDERDVIYLSIGFGFNHLGRLSLNFGPLNRQGGERRLNVLISRARECCVVFSNFRASDLSLDGNTPFGLRSLKVFLDYAENRNLCSIEATGADTDSPFEDSVYNFLRTHNYEVRKQVGCAGFRVDLAIVDSEHPGCYLLGIECDGAKYHSSPVARDRDRLRQQVLEDKGWRLCRVWSTDWYRNRTETKKALLEKVECAKRERGSVSNLNRKDFSQSSTPIPQKNMQKDEPQYFSVAEDALDKMVSNYKICSSLGISIYGELHQYPTLYLANAVIRVVNIEGPVHVEEVIRRVRTLWGVKRAGQRIKDAISKATSLAVRNGQIKQCGDFLWSTTNQPLLVRRRCEDPPPKIELICDEEITEAVKLVLKNQFATMLDDLVIKSSRILGIHVTHEATSDRIKTIIQTLLKKDELQQISNGMIDLPKC